MGLFELFRQRKAAYEEQCRVEAMEAVAAGTAWIGRLVWFPSCLAFMCPPWLVHDNGMVLGEVTGVDQWGNVVVVYAFNEQGQPAGTVGVHASKLGTEVVFADVSS
jgi:hypothetical protein